MTDTKTRVRWSEEERRQLAVEMLRLLDDDARQSKLQALLRAQSVLPEPRRRAVAAWTMVREQIEPHMQAAQRETAARAEAAAQANNEGQPPAGDAGAPPSTARESADEAPDGAGGAGSAGGVRQAMDAALIDGRGDAPSADATGASTRSMGAIAPTGALTAALAGQLNALGRLGVQALESALLQVLSSPAVAERLDALVQGALARAATAAVAAGGLADGVPGGAVRGASSTPPARALAMPRPKVLVAGLTPAQANELVEEFSESLDLRTWRPGETKDQLRSLGRVCSVAVLVAESVDHDTESMLKSMHLRIVKHAGGLPRLKERLHELVDSGMFNVLT